MTRDFESVQFAAKMVATFYVVCAMVMLYMMKVGRAMAAMTSTSYKGEAAKNLMAWSGRTKLVHAAIFVAALVIGFWQG